MYTHTYTHTQTCIHIHIHINTHTHIHTNIHIQNFINTEGSIGIVIICIAFIHATLVQINYFKNNHVKFLKLKIQYDLY